MGCIVKTYVVAIVSSLTLSGCVSMTHGPPDGPVALSYGSIDSFSALVPTSDGAPRCEDPTHAPVPAGGRAVALEYADPPAQQVTVTLNENGIPTKYLDVRGDLSTGDDRAGDRTTIGLYFTEGYAVLSNRPAGGAPVVLEVPLAEALSSDRLGDPDGRLQDVLAACAGAA